MKTCCPARHLGLVTPQEHAEAERAIQAAADLIRRLGRFEATSGNCRSCRLESDSRPSSVRAIRPLPARMHADCGSAISKAPHSLFIIRKTWKRSIGTGATTSRHRSAERFGAPADRCALYRRRFSRNARGAAGGQCFIPPLGR